MALNWSQFNRFGIRSGQEWIAGHTSDVIELDANSILVACPSSGVWQLESTLGLPLSISWDSVDMNAVIAGTGAHHYYAGGSTAQGTAALYETDVTQPFPLWSWVPVEVPTDGAGLPQAGSIVTMGITPDLATLVLATTSSLWWSPTPPPGTRTYNWSRCQGMTAASICGMDITPDGTVLAATPGAMYFGSMQAGHLVMNPSAIVGVDPAQLVAVRVASSPSDPSRAYAGCSSNEGAAGAQGTVVAVLRTDDGGHSWHAQPAIGEGGAFLVDHSQLGYDGAVAVHPNRPDTVVVGWTHSWISTDAGASFAQYTQNHDDKHSYRFTRTGRLYECNDGGVAFSDDMVTWNTGYNRDLANLQFFGPTGMREAHGRFSASTQVPELVGGGLQDNNDVYSMRWPNGSSLPWSMLEPPGLSTDGQSVYFPVVASGPPRALYAFGQIWPVTWTPPALTSAGGIIPVGIAHPGSSSTGDPLVTGPVATVRNPTYRDVHGRTMYAVTAVGTGEIYGLFASDAFEGPTWDYLATVPVAPGAVTASIASATGEHILVGIRGNASIWSVDAATGQVYPGTGLPTGATDFFVAVGDVLSHADDGSGLTAYAFVTNQHSNTTTIWSAVNSQPATTECHWQQVPASGLPNELVFAIASEPGTNPARMFAATDSTVWQSLDGGSSWTPAGSGLPRRAHCSDLAFVMNPDGTTDLHLATWGWSSWVARVPAGQ